jgi:hypothetical protein
MGTGVREESSTSASALSKGISALSKDESILKTYLEVLEPLERYMFGVGRA